MLATTRPVLNCLALALLVAPLAAQSPTVAWWNTPTLTPTPLVDGVLAVDLDGDGYPERLSAHGSQSLIGVQPGRPDGVPGAVQFLATVYGVTDLAAADFDLDGNLDIAGSAFKAFGGFNLVIARGDGLGGLLPVSAFMSGVFLPNHLVTTDAQMDGIPDVAVVSVNSSGVSLLAGDGLGGLLAPVTVHGWPGPFNPVGIAAAEVTGDSWPDLIVGGDELTILAGDGAGGLLPPFTLPEPAAVFDIATMDVDANGLDDVVTVVNGPLVGVRLQTAPGVLSGESVTALPDPDADLGLLGLGPLDDDGDVDIVVRQSGLSVGLGDGAGNFAWQSTIALGSTSGRPSIADLDFDGHADILAGFLTQSFQHGMTEVLRGNGHGGFIEPDRVEVGPSAARALAVTDGGGVPEVAAALHDADALAVLRGDGTGGLLPPLILGDAPGPVDVAWGDFDGDGTPDVAGQLDGNNSIRVHLAQGVGFGPALDTSSLRQPTALATGDMDGDGRLDVIAAGPVNDDAVSLEVQLGDGTGKFPATGAALAHVNSYVLAVGDVTGDGDLDTVTFGDGLVLTVRPGNGAGGLLPGVKLHDASMGQAQDIAIGDVDEDGAADILLSLDVFGNGGSLGRVEWIGGTLVDEPGTPLVGIPGGMVLADGDGDGDVDVALSLPQESVVEWHWNDGAGDLAAASALWTAGKPDEPLAVDLDLDGLRDLVVLDASAPELVLVHTVPSPWVDLGYALEGSAGTPALDGAGMLLEATPGAVDVSGAPPLAPAGLFIGLAGAFLPFHGGTFVPALPLGLYLPTDAQGALHFAWSTLPALPTGATFYLQAWIQDAGVTAGVAGSNALLGTVP